MPRLLGAIAHFLYVPHISLHLFPAAWHGQNSAMDRHSYYQYDPTATYKCPIGFAMQDMANSIIC